MDFIDVETARQRRGLRLIVGDRIPSPWSEAAKGLFRLAGIPFACIRGSTRNPEAWQWAGVASSPAALFDDEPARTDWGRIFALAERLAPHAGLAPRAPADRALMLGLGHELLGERGLAWCRRLDQVHASFVSNGERSFPLAVSAYLAGKYGYFGADDMPSVRTRMLGILAFLDERLQQQAARGYPTYFDDGPTALDVQSAVTIGMFVPYEHALCPMVGFVRLGYECIDEDLRAAITPALLAHRDRVYRTVLELPIPL